VAREHAERTMSNLALKISKEVDRKQHKIEKLERNYKITMQK